MGFHDRASTSPQFSDWGLRKRTVEKPSPRDRVRGWTYISVHARFAIVASPGAQRIRDLFVAAPASSVASNSVHRSNPPPEPCRPQHRGGGVFWTRHTPNLAFGRVTSMALGTHRLARKGSLSTDTPRKNGSRGHAESSSHQSRLRGRDFRHPPIGKPYLKQAGRALVPSKSSYLARGSKGFGREVRFAIGIPVLTIWGASIGGRWSW